MKNSKRGFTLIELLVVIAIIGILASVVLASLNSARRKGDDAAIKSNLDTIRKQAELFADEHSLTYGTARGVVTCSTAAGSSGANLMYKTTADGGDDNIYQAHQAMRAIHGNDTGSAYCATGVGGGSYAVAARMRTDTTQFLCIDSSGVSRMITVTSGGPALGGGTAAAACPAS